VIFESLSGAERRVWRSIGFDLGSSAKVFSEPSTRRAQGPPRSARRSSDVFARRQRQAESPVLRLFSRAAPVGDPISAADVRSVGGLFMV